MAFFSDHISDNSWILNGETSDPSAVIIRQSDQDNGREISMDRDMLRVFAGVDGKRSLADLAVLLGMSSRLITEVVKRLLDAGVVEVVDGFEKGPGAVFLDYLETQLALAIGPIAPLVLEDEVEAMRETWRTFPMERAPELVNILARQIPREEKRFAFQQAMIRFLKDAVR